MAKPLCIAVELAYNDYELGQPLRCSPTHVGSTVPQVTFTKLETGHLPAREQREDEIRAFRKKQVGCGGLELSGPGKVWTSHLIASLAPAFPAPY